MGESWNRELLERIYRDESRRVLATLIRLLGDFDSAEEAMHDAFASAAAQWPRDGVPDNARAWLVSAGRFKAIDRIRKSARLNDSLELLAQRVEERSSSSARNDEDLCVEDDQLRLIFTCCHPALAPEAQLALTLREVCGLKTEEIATALLSSQGAVAQRIVRAKAKIRDAGIPYVVPSVDELPERLDIVLRVMYLVFSEGYSASQGDSVTRVDLTGEAVRLARLLMALMPDPEVAGLLALMLLQNSRRSARMTSDGDLILLEDQDRSLWNREEILEGADLVRRSLNSGRFGPYTLQAAIAGVHAEARTSNDTDWDRIVAFYNALMELEPSPVVDLNRAVAVAMSGDIESGLKIVDRCLDAGRLDEYPLAHAARADLCRRLGRSKDAIASYRKALELTRQTAQQRFLRKRLAELGATE